MLDPNVMIGLDLLRISASLDRHSLACVHVRQELAQREKQMSKNNMIQESKEGHRDESLDSRYREIGISAVAAVLQFKGNAKNPAYAPAVIATTFSVGATWTD
jgi:hypothetical protein